MLLAVRCRLAILDIEARLFCAGVMRAAPAFNAHHAIHSMLLAVRCRPTLDIAGRLFDARVMRAALAFNAHHAIHSMLLAVRCRLATLDIEGRSFCAGVV